MPTDDRLKMAPARLRELSTEELRTKLEETVREHYNLRFRSATESIPNPMKFRDLRRDIARMQTILRERELGR